MKRFGLAKNEQVSQQFWIHDLCVTKNDDHINKHYYAMLEQKRGSETSRMIYVCTYPVTMTIKHNRNITVMKSLGRRSMVFLDSHNIEWIWTVQHIIT